MQFIDFFSKGRSARVHAQFFCMVLWCSTCFAQGQDVPSLPVSAPAALATVGNDSNAVPQGLQWNNLSAQNQTTLAPLQSSWKLLGEAHQRKWLVLAKNFPNMTPAEQEKLHGRMVEWAALTPKERELARLNFAETKKLSQQERSANWEAYQALGDDDRKLLAAKAASKKAKGGARSIKPPKNNKLAVVPVVRNAPDSLRALLQLQPAIHPLTLLPTRPASAAPLPPP
jgi:hypothetical protein